jgi:hypothetical protein
MTIADCGVKGWKKSGNVRWLPTTHPYPITPHHATIICFSLSIQTSVFSVYSMTDFIWLGNKYKIHKQKRLKTQWNLWNKATLGTSQKSNQMSLFQRCPYFRVLIILIKKPETSWGVLIPQGVLYPTLRLHVTGFTVAKHITQRGCC